MRTEFRRRNGHWQKKIRFQSICGTIRKYLKKPCTDTQMKLYKVVARPTLLYGSETWVPTKRDMTRLEAAEMRFLRSVKSYTRLDKIRNEVIRKEFEISGIKDVKSKYSETCQVDHLHKVTTYRCWPHIGRTGEVLYSLHIRPPP